MDLITSNFSVEMHKVPLIPLLLRGNRELASVQTLLLKNTLVRGNTKNLTDFFDLSGLMSDDRGGHKFLHGYGVTTPYGDMAYL